MNALIIALNRCGEWFATASVGMLLQSSVLIAILATLDWLLRNRARAIVRYSFWMLLLVKLILPVNLSSPTSVIQITPAFKYTPPEYPEPGIQAPSFDTTRPSSTLADAIEPATEPQAMTKSLAPTESIPAVPSAGLTPFGWTFIAWASISSILLAVTLWKTAKLRRLINSCRAAPEEMLMLLTSCCEQMGIRQRVELRVGDVTPALCRIVRPCILLPTSLVAALDRNEMRAVLLHELAHLKRRDVLVNVIQTVLQIIFFFHPLLWLANARIRKLREQAVDELVLVTMGPEADLYPATLLDVAKFTLNARALSFGSVGIMESRSAFASRLRRMLTRPFPRSARLGMACVTAMTLLALCVLPMASRAKEEKPAAPPTVAHDPKEFLANLRFYPDPFFPEYKSTTNQIVQMADSLLALILEELQTPLADHANADLRRNRGKKIWALSIMGEKAKPAIPALIKELEDEDPANPRGPHYLDYPPSFWAAAALGNIGPSASNSVPALIEAAHFGNYKAVPALARIAPDSSEVQTLAIETFNDLSKGNGGNISFSRLAGLEALSVLAQKPGKARENFLAAVTDSDPPIRNAAVKLVAASKLPGANEAIEKGLGADQVTRVNTAAALASTGDRSDRVRNALIEGLKEPVTRLKALEALSLLPMEGAQLVPLLLPFLEDSDQAVRLAVLQLLPRFPRSKNEAVARAVLPLLEETDSVRQAAMVVIGQNGLVTPAVVEALRKAFQDSNSEIRGTAVNTAQALKAPELAPELLKLSEDPDDQVRTGALIAVSEFPEVAKPLLPEITSELNGERGWAAAIALGNMGTNAASAVPALQAQLNATNRNALNNCIYALGKIGPAARPTLPALERLLTDSEPMIQLNAALALWRIDRQQHIVGILEDRLESQEHWGRLDMLNPVPTRIHLLSLAKELGSDAQPIIPAVKRYVNDAEPAIRKAATETLAALEPQNAASPLKLKTNDELLAAYEPYGENRKRSQAAIYSELLSRPDVVPFLSSKLRKSSGADTADALATRKKAATLLGKLGPAAASAVPTLIDGLEDEEDVRRAVTQTLGEIGPDAKQALPILFEELHFQNQSAPTALVRIDPNSEKVLEALVEQAGDSSRNPDFRREAGEALRRMKLDSKSRTQVIRDLEVQGVLSVRTKREWIFNNPAKYTAADVPALTERLEKSPNDIEAINALAQLRTNAAPAVPALMKILEGKRSRYPGSIVTAIGNTGAAAKPALPLLIQSTRSDDFGASNNSLVALRQIGPDAIEAKPTLLEMMKTSDIPDVRWQAARALWDIDPSDRERCVPALLAGLDLPKDRREYAIRFLAEIGDYAKPVVPRLHAMFKNESDEWTRFGTVQAIIKLDPARSSELVPGLLGLLQDETVMNQHEAARLLGEIGAPAESALPALKSSSTNENPLLAKSSSEAIQKIENTSKKSN